MNKKEYDKEVRKWNKWAVEFEKYHNRKMQLIEELKGETREQLNEIERRLEAEFGKKDADMFYGPWTKIYSLADLSNPEFILPGMSESFMARTYSAKVISAWGKEIESELGKDFSGKVIGYAYDAGDDYLIIDKGDGQEVYMILNSQWKIKEDV